MSDVSLLTSLENLINIAMGPPEKNILNYKILQKVLHLLAHHMRILETKVEIRISDDDGKEQTDIKHTKVSSSTSQSTSSSSTATPSPRGIKEKSTKTEKTKVKGEKAAHKERKKDEQTDLKEKQKVEHRGAKEKEKAEKHNIEDKYEPKKEKHKAEMAAEKNTSKEKEKYFEETQLEKIPTKEKEEYLREKETEERELEKITPKEREINNKDKINKTRDKEKTLPREKEQRADKEKEEKALDQITREEKKQYLKGKERPLEWNKDRTASGSSITVTEVERHKEKVLIVEKGLTPRSEPRTRGGNIEVVTQAEFRVLEEVVMELKEKARPLSKPTLPGSKKLRSDLVKGTASLTDTMEAMQVTARVQAAEQEIERMAKLLTQLAGAGALPQEFAEQLEEVKAAMELERQVDQKSRAIDSMTTKPSRTEGVSQTSDGRAFSPRFTVHSRVAVTPDHMATTVRMMKAELMNKIKTMMESATITAETAACTIKAVAQSFNAALDLNDRINTLYSLTSHCTEQLTSFDTDITAETQNFNEQMAQLKVEMEEGLTQLTSVNKHTETTVVTKLTEQYEVLSSDLEESLPSHQRLAGIQRQLGLELQNLKKAVQMLQEQKAERDKLEQGLNDKINTLQLNGLVTIPIFDNARAELEMKLVACYANFTKQESGWMSALRDLSTMQDTKADIMQLLIIKHDAQKSLQSIQDKLKQLAIELGEPELAKLMRVMSKDGHCGLCKKGALMYPLDANYGQPMPLPALHPPLHPPPGTELPAPKWPPCAPTDEKEHICNRWTGGSHTLMLGAPAREAAQPAPAPVALVRRYTGYGSDGAPYKMEEKVQPCIECLKNPAKRELPQ